ncbi:MAG TPA: hypothetical protein VIH06_10265, partial [Ilumatobacteraceae bacterium]
TLIAFAGTGAAACGSDATTAGTALSTGATSAAEAVPASAPTPTTTPAAGSTVVFADALDDDRNGWGIINSPQYGTTSYEAGDYVWNFMGSNAHWLASTVGDQFDHGTLDMLDVTVHADVTVESGGGVVGVFCRENPGTNAEFQWYEFVLRDEYAAIRRADSEGNIKPLAETHDVTAPLGQSLALEGSCVGSGDDAALAMRLNGTELLTATDDDHPLVNGAAGMQAYTFPVHEQMMIRWHDFSVEHAG